MSYLWPKPGTQKPVSKLSYVPGFDPWGWTVGIGVYVDDVGQAVHLQTVSALEQTVAPLGLMVVLALSVTVASAVPFAA